MYPIHIPNRSTSVCAHANMDVIIPPSSDRMISLWQLTPEEQENIRATGIVALSIYASAHPPVALYVPDPAALVDEAGLQPLHQESTPPA